MLGLQLTAGAALAADPSTVKAAEQLANQAYEAQAAGRYPDAIAAYLKAYELSNAAAILYNVAFLYDRKLGEPELAKDFYRRYLAATDADPVLAGKATERLAAIKREADEAAARQKALAGAPLPATTPAPTTAPAAPAAPASSAPATEPSTDDGGRTTWHVLGVTTGVIGLAGVATGLALGAVAKQKNDQANGYCNGAACNNPQGVTLAHDAGTFATASTITFIAGLALVGVGVTFYVAAPSGGGSTQSASLSFSPMVGPGQAGLGAGGTF